MPGWGWVLLIVVAYIVIMLLMGLGPWASLAHVRVDDYFKVSAGVGFLVLYLGMAGGFHTSFCIPGSMGFYYGHGVPFVINVIWTIGTPVFLLYTLGTRICALSKKYNYVSPADMLVDYYVGNPDSPIRWFFSIFLLVFSVVSIVANVTGPAVVLSYATEGHIPYWFAVALIVGLATYYVTGRGIRGVMWTTVLQAIWMFVAMWAAAFVCLELIGGWKGLVSGGLMEKILKDDPKLWTYPGARNWLKWPMYATWPIFGICIGWTLTPRSWYFYFSARDVDTFKKIALTQPLYLCLIYVPVIIIGFVSRVYIPGLKGAAADNAFPMLMAKYFPALLSGLLAAGSMAAGMSTLDADLNANSGMVTRDIYMNIKKGQDDKTYVKFGQTVVVILGVLGFIFALRRSQLVTMIITLSMTGAAQLLPAVLSALYDWKWLKLSAAGVVMGIIVGTLVLIGTTWGIVLPKEPYGMHPGFWGVLVNFIVAIVVSAFTEKPPKETQARYHGYLKQVLG